MRLRQSIACEYCVWSGLLNPTAEIRMAAGRELHLRACRGWDCTLLTPVYGRLFKHDGYIDTQTFQMIKDGGFDIKSDKQLDQLLAVANCNSALTDTAMSEPVFKMLKRCGQPNVLSLAPLCYFSSKMLM